MTKKFKGLVEAYHRTHGFQKLPELLWAEGPRAFIETNGQLLTVFKYASRLRSAKKAYTCYVMIATVILTIEALASDFAGWGRHFPSARGKALLMYGQLSPEARPHLLDFYLSPRSYMPPEMLSRISPS